MELFELITFKDLIDISAVAILLYQILLIVKGTRAVQMLFGVAGLAIVFWLSLSYKLHTLHWILDNFFDSFFVIFIILFQDQIRVALASFGSGRKVFSGMRRSDAPSPVEEMVEVSMTNSKKRIGGLIVIERINGLRNYVLTGTPLNSNIHCDLIFAIFQSTSPLHDGAIIVQKSKLLAAGCFLPLSKNVDIDRHLGTRHRAALGISEATDAIAIVVSEETGLVSVAEKGRFHQVNSKVELSTLLKRLLSGKSSLISSAGEA